LKASVQSGNPNRVPHGPSRVEHAPVMLSETIDLLQCRPGGIFVDATIGLAGHAGAILKNIRPDGLLIGLDRDSESLAIARSRLKPDEKNIRLFHANFKNLPLILNNLGLKTLDGILADLGVSAYQLLAADRGFSFQSDALLDMRMDRSQRLTASDLVNGLPEEELADLILRFGEEPRARRIASSIVRARQKGPVTRCAQLADVIARAAGGRASRRTHPATRTFQALRIAVNQELEGLEEFMREALTFLRPGGRLAVIAFHSLEDRIVKRSFRMLAGHCVCGRRPPLCTCPRNPVGRLVRTRAVKPGAAEVAVNPRARSARLRVLERVQAITESEC